MIKGYVPKRGIYRTWINVMIVNLPSRHTVARCLNQIRKEEGNTEALAFVNWLVWLGVYPIRTNVMRAKA